MKTKSPIAIWGGMECTINRVGDQYFDQSEYSGHYLRGTADIDRIAALGIRTLRYPVLWERHLPQAGCTPDWSFTDRSLGHMRTVGITPIAGLVHHGSGPAYVNFFDGSFEQGLERYARMVAERYPWLEYYTPVNEPLTTARFCGLYGHWYPHGRDYKTFFRILLSECKATVLAMRAIREVNPSAKLIQTEDLGKCHSTALLQCQADFENERRWLSYELLCGTLRADKVMYRFMLSQGIPEEDLQWFIDNPCPPDIAGFNYYLTSERYLDEDRSRYPRCYHGGNGQHRYADVHTVHAPMTGKETGPYQLLKEAWGRLGLPMAITECHLHSRREDQMRWFHSMWKTVNRLKDDGVDMRAITAWALFGLHGWNRLVTRPKGLYEPGVFSIRGGGPRPTALAAYIRELTSLQDCAHPVLAGQGWWERSDRLIFGGAPVVPISRSTKAAVCRPLLVLGKTGTLGKAFGHICRERHIHFVLLGRDELDLTDPTSIREALKHYDPWGVVNAAGYVDVDRAEQDEDTCMRVNADGAIALAAACAERAIRYLAFSSDLVFDGGKRKPYVETDKPSPLNAYGRSKMLAENGVLAANPGAVMIRTSAFFGPWDEYNFLAAVLRDLSDGKRVRAAGDLVVAPTYVPDLVHTALDLLLDGEQGICHVANCKAVSWAEFAREIAVRAGYDERMIEAVPHRLLRWAAQRPGQSALRSSKGIRLPGLGDAIDRCLEALGHSARSTRIAV
ncbi:MAG: NAD-dependent epimerase/dehydratase family protein [Chitinophagaceae bacterium]|nr:MAG: NAD-dependent epimerase/dehydratase family protein [Chitinophagaceae bacterium]